MIKRVDIQVVDLENIDVERKPIVDAFTRYETLAKNALWQIICGLATNKEREFCIKQKDLQTLVKISSKRLKDFLKEFKQEGLINYDLVEGKQNVNDMYDTTTLCTMIKIL